MAKETWATMSRSKAVVRVLETAGEPLTTAEIAAMLQKKGRDEDSAAILRVVSYLERANRITRPERGRYTVAVAPKSTKRAA